MEHQQQYVGIDLHRLRSVIVRMTEAGEVLECVRITNDPVALSLELAKAGPDAEVAFHPALTHAPWRDRSEWVIATTDEVGCPGISQGTSVARELVIWSASRSRCAGGGHGPADAIRASVGLSGWQSGWWCLGRG